MGFDRREHLQRQHHREPQAVENERPYNELTSIITKDIGATTRLIRIASSAYYHLDKGISIERALSYIGINAIRQILLFTSLADGAQWDTRRRKHLFDISIHSVLVNYGVCELYRIEHEAPIPEHYTSVGITHDIGKVIMLGYLPERFDRVITCMKDHPGLDFYQGELSLGFGGTTHAEIGAFFLDLWGLPGPSIEAGLYHHDPKNGPEGGDNGESILELCRTADLLSNYIVLRPDAAHEELPGFLERYTKKNEIHDLIVALEEKYEHFQ